MYKHWIFTTFDCTAHHLQYLQEYLKEGICNFVFQKDPNWQRVLEGRAKQRWWIGYSLGPPIVNRTSMTSKRELMPKSKDLPNLQTTLHKAHRRPFFSFGNAFTNKRTNIDELLQMPVYVHKSFSLEHLRCFICILWIAKRNEDFFSLAKWAEQNHQQWCSLLHGVWTRGAFNSEKW